MPKTKNIWSEEEELKREREALQYIEAQLEGGYVDLDSDLYYGNELDIIREAIKLYKESKGIE